MGISRHSASSIQDFQKEQGLILSGLELKIGPVKAAQHPQQADGRKTMHLPTLAANEICNNPQPRKGQQAQPLESPHGITCTEQRSCGVGTSRRACLGSIPNCDRARH